VSKVDALSRKMDQLHAPARRPGARKTA